MNSQIAFNRILLSIFLLLAGEVFSQSVEEIISNKVQQYYDSTKLPAIVASYLPKDKRHVTLAFGIDDRATMKRMSATTRMPGGSTGKTFVMALAMQLINEGKFNLDDKVEMWLGTEDWFERLPNANDLTIRNLLQHTTGVERYEFKADFVKLATSKKDKVWEPEELVSFVLDDKPLFEAGKGFTYSDTNFIILGMVIEKVSGIPYYDQVIERFIKPLKLKSVEPQLQRKYKNLSVGYSSNEDPLGFKGRSLDENGEFRYNVQFEWTGGGLIFNASDYAKWLQQLYSGNLFSQELFEIVTTGIDANEIGGQYGLGTQIMTIEGMTFFGHSGFFPGYLTIGFLNEKDGTVFVMQGNSSEPEYIKPFFDLYFEILVELANK